MPKKGSKSTNQAEMTSGSELHRLHGRQVLGSRITRTLALILLLIALVLLAAFCTSQII